jgi:hypothetical protein
VTDEGTRGDQGGSGRDLAVWDAQQHDVGAGAAVAAAMGTGHGQARGLQCPGQGTAETAATDHGNPGISRGVG